MNGPVFRPTLTRRELLWLGWLILVVLATRLPFLMHGLDEWDSANFALSLLGFDVLHHQPHPPGQYVYVRLLQGIDTFTGNELFTLSLASAVGSTLALVPYYFTMRQMFRPAVAFGAAVLTAWTFGYWVTSLRLVSDPVACLFVNGTVCALLLGLRDRRWFWFGMALCGVTLGVKQTTVYFLAPVTLAVNGIILWRHGWRRPLGGSGLFAVAVAAWLLPTVNNCHGWANYLAACRAMQVQNYTEESVVFHLSAYVVRLQEQQNLFQPWGNPFLAMSILALALAGVVVLLRRGTRGALYALFGLTVACYAFFFLYRFNKYYVYYLPFYCAAASAGLFASSAWLARVVSLPVLRHLLPGAAIALVTAVNVFLTAPLLPGIAHFRAPPQAALESLRKMPGVGLRPTLLTDDPTASRELVYFDRKNRVDLLNQRPDLHDAVAALNAGQPVYLLSPLLFGQDVDGAAPVRLVGSYAWRPGLYRPLQGRPDLQRLFLYALNAPLPEQYTFPEPGSRPPLLETGIRDDGWCAPQTHLVLPCDGPTPALAHLRFTFQEGFGYQYPYRMVCQFADGTHQDFTVEHAGRADFVVPVPDRPGARAVELDLRAPLPPRPPAEDARDPYHRGFAVQLAEVACVTAARPLLVHREAGWYGEESDATRHWRWTDGNAALSILLNRADTLRLTATALSYTEGNALEVLVDGQPAGEFPLPGTTWRDMDCPLPLTAGFHRVVLHSRSPGTVLPGDGRTLALRVQDLRVRFDR